MSARRPATLLFPIRFPRPSPAKVPAAPALSKLIVDSVHRSQAALPALARCQPKAALLIESLIKAWTTPAPSDDGPTNLLDLEIARHDEVTAFFAEAADRGARHHYRSRAARRR